MVFVDWVNVLTDPDLSVTEDLIRELNSDMCSRLGSNVFGHSMKLSRYVHNISS